MGVSSVILMSGIYKICCGMSAMEAMGFLHTYWVGSQLTVSCTNLKAVNLYYLWEYKN